MANKLHIFKTLLLFFKQLRKKFKKSTQQLHFNWHISSYLVYKPAVTHRRQIKYTPYCFIQIGYKASTAGTGKNPYLASIQWHAISFKKYIFYMGMCMLKCL